MATRTSIWDRLVQDEIFRRKFLRTLCIMFSYTSLGFFFSNLGPALPDIQFLIGESLGVTSWLFTATSVGSLIGTVICGPVCDRVGPQVVLFVSVFMGSCLTGVFIYCPTFTAMLIVRVFTGLFIGGVDIGGIASVTDLWQLDARPYLHALQLMLSVGGIVTPFIIAPFLANRIKKHTTSVNDLAIMLNKTTVSSNASQINDTNMTHINISDVFSICFDKGKETNISYSFDTVFCDNITEVQGGKRVEEGTLIGKTNIQYAFIILAVIGVTASGTVLAFLIADFKARNRNRKTAASNEIKNTGYRKYSISERLKYILLIIVAIQCYLIAAMSSKVYALLPSFFILQFTWTTPMASVAMSVFWIGKAAARLAGIFLSAQFKQSVLIPCFSLTYIISSAGLIISGLYQISELAWISTASLGIGLSILFPSLFAITEENISHVSGRIASFYLVFFVVGGVFDPLYTGYLMDKGSPMWFTYLIFAQSIIFLILFITVKLLLRAYGEWKTAEAEIEIEPMSEEGKT